MRRLAMLVILVTACGGSEAQRICDEVTGEPAEFGEVYVMSAVLGSDDPDALSAALRAECSDEMTRLLGSNFGR